MRLSSHEGRSSAVLLAAAVVVLACICGVSLGEAAGALEYKFYDIQKSNGEMEKIKDYNDAAKRCATLFNGTLPTASDKATLDAVLSYVDSQLTESPKRAAFVYLAATRRSKDSKTCGIKADAANCVWCWTPKGDEQCADGNTFWRGYRLESRDEQPAGSFDGWATTAVEGDGTKEYDDHLMLDTKGHGWDATEKDVATAVTDLLCVREGDKSDEPIWKRLWYVWVIVLIVAAVIIMAFAIACCCCRKPKPKRKLERSASQQSNRNNASMSRAGSQRGGRPPSSAGVQRGGRPPSSAGVQRGGRPPSSAGGQRGGRPLPRTDSRRSSASSRYEDYDESGYSARGSMRRVPSYRNDDDGGMPTRSRQRGSMSDMRRDGQHRDSAGGQRSGRYTGEYDSPLRRRGSYRDDDASQADYRRGSTRDMGYEGGSRRGSTRDMGSRSNRSSDRGGREGGRYPDDPYSFSRPLMRQSSLSSDSEEVKPYP